MNDSLLETIQTIQQRAERLEQEAAELRQELARVADVLISPSSVVARYVIEDETYEITQADVEGVKSELAKSAEFRGNLPRCRHPGWPTLSLCSTGRQMAARKNVT